MEKVRCDFEMPPVDQVVQCGYDAGDGYDAVVMAKWDGTDWHMLIAIGTWYEPFCPDWWRKEGHRLIYSLADAYDSGENRHPSYVMHELGITWDDWTPQEVAEQIVVDGVPNVPDNLPDFIRVLK